jgi:CBS domain-containing protein
MNTCPACGDEIIAGAESCDNCGCDLGHLSRPRARTKLDKSFHKQPVSVLRPHDAVVVPLDRKVQDVLASMVLHRDGCAVVVDQEGKVAGVFSERDLLLRIAGIDHSKLEGPVSDVMTPDPMTIESDAPIAYALHAMDLGGYRHLPLVEDGKPVGMISIRDIVTYIGDRFTASADE